MSHNKQLDALLAQVRTVVKAAREERDFAKAFSLLRNFKTSVGPIRYDNSRKWYALAATALLGAGFGLVAYLDPTVQERLGDAIFLIGGGFAIAIITLLCLIGGANSAIGEISDLLFLKDVYYDNRLAQQDIGDGSRELYERYHREFGEFRNRGDENRYISSQVRGSWTGDAQTLDTLEYDYYVFHYVRVYYVPVTRKVGKSTITTMERRTQTLYRYGILLDFPFVKGLAVTSSGGSYDYAQGYQPTSEAFCGTFGVGADSSHVAARFLKPAVVLAFEELATHFSGLNVEINREGRMNIAFSDSDVLHLERQNSIAEPEAFEQEVMSHLGLPKLRHLLQFVRTLERHSDNNFTETEQAGATT